LGPFPAGAGKSANTRAVAVEETEGERLSSREKITSMVVSTSTGWPFKLVGA